MFCHESFLLLLLRFSKVRALPFLLQVAAMTRRLILIYWERPAPLETFLEPGPLNWTVPWYMLEGGLEFGLLPALTRVQDVQDNRKLTSFPKQVLDSRFQAYHEGQLYYDSHKVNLEDPSMESIFASVWKLFFDRPTASIRNELEQFWDNFPRFSYDATHARILYTATNDTGNISRAVANALACTQLLGKTSPDRVIFFASDSIDASILALEYGRQYSNSSTVVVSPLSANGTSENPPLHLDRGRDFLTPTKGNFLDGQKINKGIHPFHSPSARNHSAPAYNSIFVDLYLLAGAKCLSFDRGGFGKLAALLSGTKCYRKHRVRQCSAESKSNASTTEI